MTYRFFEAKPRDKHIEFFDDFFSYAAGDWVITTVETGTATEALEDADGGVLVVTNGTADNDSDFFQWAGGSGGVQEQFKFVAGKRLYFKAKFKLTEATQADMVMGLQITDTSPLAVTDGIYFRKDDDDLNLDFVVIKNSTATTITAVGVMADNTWMEAEFYYDGAGGIDVAINGVQVASAALTNVPDDEELAVSFGVQNGVITASAVLRVDYIHVVKER